MSQLSRFRTVAFDRLSRRGSGTQNEALPEMPETNVVELPPVRAARQEIISIFKASCAGDANKVIRERGRDDAYRYFVSESTRALSRKLDVSQDLSKVMNGALDMIALFGGLGTQSYQDVLERADGHESAAKTAVNNLKRLHRAREILHVPPIGLPHFRRG